jgi:ABC-type glycerol-3-phosphate transport system permease component
MRSMFHLVPREVIDAARVDGAGHWRTLWMVGLPMVRNGHVVIFIVNFVAAWGEYLLRVTLIDDEARRTMPVVLAAAQGGQGYWAWPNLAAVYIIVTTPGLVAFAFAQRLFFKGLAEGVTKLLRCCLRGNGRGIFRPGADLKVSRHRRISQWHFSGERSAARPSRRGRTR